MSVVSAFDTNVGLVSANKSLPNEDIAVTFEIDGVLYAIVSDGNGTVNDMKPSGFAINEIQRYLNEFSKEKMTSEQIKDLMYQAFFCANRVLMAYKRANNQLYTNDNFATMTMAAFTNDNRFVFAHTGDSRLYLVRNERLIQLTKDHTAAQKLCDEGKLPKEQVVSHPDNKILTSAIGFPDVRIDTTVGALKKGDIILGVTDGIHKMLSSEQILDVILAAGTCEGTCDGLIQYSNNQGGFDNMAVFVAYIPEE